MNARTKITANGDVSLPLDVRERLHWTPGTPIEVVETVDGVTLRVPKKGGCFPPTTLDDLRAFSPYEGSPKSVEEISRLSDEAIRRLLDASD